MDMSSFDLTTAAFVNAMKARKWEKAPVPSAKSCPSRQYTFVTNRPLTIDPNSNRVTVNVDATPHFHITTSGKIHHVWFQEKTQLLFTHAGEPRDGTSVQIFNVVNGFDEINGLSYVVPDLSDASRDQVKRLDPNPCRPA